MRIFWLMTVLMGVACGLIAAPSRYQYGQENTIVLKEVRDSVDDIRHEVNNHESEIRMFEEKLKNQEAIVDSLRDQFQDSVKVSKENAKESSNGLEMRLLSLENNTKGLVSDFKQLKTHANETSTALSQCKQKLAHLESSIDSQYQNLENMQAALHSLMDAMQVKNGLEKLDKIYRVKSGDSLEKIAKAHQTSIKTLKEMNGLTQDRIIVGQSLKIP